MTFAPDIEDDWHSYVCQIEQLTGRTINDGHVIDMLYAAYMGGVEPVVAADSIEGLEHVGVVVARLLEGIQMRADLPSTKRPIVRWWRSLRLSKGEIVGYAWLAAIYVLVLWGIAAGFAQLAAHMRVAWL